MENIDYRKKLEQVLEILDQGEELNMSNYNHDLVRQLNDTFVEAWLFVESALAENTPTSSEQLAAPAVVGQSEQLKAFQNLPSETKDYQNTKHGLFWKTK